MHARENHGIPSLSQTCLLSSNNVPLQHDPLTMSSQWLKSCTSAKVASGETIAFICDGNPSASQAILLVHGYPQTLFSMRYVARQLSEKGLYVVTADYKGAGGSSAPPSGYDKMTMSAELHSLMTDVLKIPKYAVLGHDIGSMVATAQALQFRDSVHALIIMGEQACAWSSNSSSTAHCSDLMLLAALRLYRVPSAGDQRLQGVHHGACQDDGSRFPLLLPQRLRLA